MSIHSALIARFIAQPLRDFDLDFRNGIYRRNGVIIPTLGGVAGLTHAQSGECWEEAPDGTLVAFTSNEPRILTGYGLWARGTFSTKCTNYNANPTALTNVTKSGAAAATLTVVDDAAALASAGLGPICSSGKVYKLDNSSGATVASAVIGGSAGNINLHRFSAYIRGGSGHIKDSWSGAPVTAAEGLFGADANYRRVSRLRVAANSAAQMQIVADPGQILFFVLNEFFESSQIGPVIESAGSSASNGAARLTIPFAQRDEDFVILVAVNMVDGSTGAARYIAQLKLDNDNRWLIRFGTDNTALAIARSAGVNQQIGPLAPTLGSGKGVIALRYKAGKASIAVLFGGGAPTISAEVSVNFPASALTALHIGHDDGATQLNGLIERNRILQGTFDNAAWTDLITEMAA